MVTTRPPKTIVKPTALGLVANTDTKLLIYGLFQKGRVLAQDAVFGAKQNRDFWTEVFNTGRSSGGVQVFTGPISVIDMMQQPGPGRTP